MMRKRRNTSRWRTRLSKLAQTSQREVLCDVMLTAEKCGAWLTLRELSRMTGFGEASISAQLRHLRKPQYGSFVVQKRRREDEEISRTMEPGVVWEYQLRRSRRSRRPRHRTWLTPALLRGVVQAASQI
jgi:hypothetical protein